MSARPIDTQIATTQLKAVPEDVLADALSRDWIPELHRTIETSRQQP